MNDLSLNEGTYNRIQNVLDASKTEKINYSESCFKSVYSPATLINNWQEFRNDNDLPDTNTEPMISENMDKFRFQCESEIPDRKEYFNKIFEGYGIGQELLIDHMGFSYYGNYTTTYDLCFNHLPKGICGPHPRFYHKGKYKPSTDLTLIYGNLTNWGLKERFQHFKKRKNKEILPTTESKAEYVHYDILEVKKLNDFPSFKKIKTII